MENAVEALKIAFAVMMFVLALTVSISSFSNANLAVKSLISMNDRENEYTYVEPTDDLSRIVGIETVVSSMYRAIEQNIEIYFKDINGDLLPLFYRTQIDIPGHYVKDNGAKVEVYSIDFSVETPQYANMYLDIILGGTSKIENLVRENLSNETEEVQDDYIEMYTKKIQNHYPQGLYEAFKDKEFKEEFGEYNQGEKASEIKKRVITYTMIN